MAAFHLPTLTPDKRVASSLLPSAKAYLPSTVRVRIRLATMDAPNSTNTALGTSSSPPAMEPIARRLNSGVSLK